MRKAAMDTCVLIDLFDGIPRAAKAVSAFDRILVPAVVIGEYRAGVDTSTRRGRLQESRLTDFLADEAVSVVDATEETAGCYARLFRDLQGRGKPLGWYSNLPQRSLPSQKGKPFLFSASSFGG